MGRYGRAIVADLEQAERANPNPNPNPNPNRNPNPSPSPDPSPNQVEQILANFHAYSADEPERGAALGRVAHLAETTDPAMHSERQWEIHAWLQAHPR